MSQLNPEDFIITRKRKKYKFALFSNSPLCFELEDWKNESPVPSFLEIGAGTALFSVALARKDPSRQFLAVDVKADRLQKGAGVAASEGMSNLRFLRARADQLADLIAPGSLDGIWVTFPDPFPKDRSSKHRLTHPRFLEIYSQLLGKDGALYFKTDARALFDWSLEQMAGQGWTIKELSFDLHESNLDQSYKELTTYERRFINEGLKTYFVKAMPPVV